MATSTFRSAAAALTLSAGLLAVPAARAGAFSASAVFDLFVADIVCATCSPDDIVFTLTPNAVFDASGDADADAAAGVLDADPLSFSAFGDAFAEGSAIAFPLDAAEASADAYLFVGIENLTGEDVAIEVGYLYGLEASATAPLKYSDAIADAFFELFAEDFDGTVASVLEAVTADALLGPEFASADGDGAFTLFLPAGEIGIIDIVASAYGYGEAVPLPSSVALMGLGLGLFGWVRRGRGTAAGTA